MALNLDEGHTEIKDPSVENPEFKWWKGTKLHVDLFHQMKFEKSLLNSLQKGVYKSVHSLGSCV